MSWSPNNDEASSGNGRPRSGGIRASNVFDLQFVKSLGGVLLIIQFVCLFLGLVLSCSWRGSYTGGHVFFVLVMVLALFSGLFIFAGRAIRLEELLRKDIPWELMMFCYSACGGLLVLIASCVMVQAAKAFASLKAAGVFGLFAWNALLASTFLHGKPFWQQRMQLLPVPATATVTPGAQNAPPRGGEDVDDDFSDDEWSDEETGEQATTEVTLKHVTARPTSYVATTGGSQPPPYQAVAPSSKRMSAVYNPTTETWSPA